MGVVYRAAGSKMISVRKCNYITVRPTENRFE